MKNFPVSLFLFLCFIICSLNTYGAFVIKADSVAVEAHNRTAPAIMPLPTPQYNDHHREGNHAVSALYWAIGGLLFSPLGIIAFVKGIQALKRKERNKGVAIVAVVLGSLEILLLIAEIAASIFFVLA